MIITDTHTHSNVSPDGADSPEILSAAARQNSVDILCITDHFEVPEKDEDDYKNIAPKIAQTFSVRDDSTLVGIELGGAVYDPDFAKDFLNEFDFDFVLGSLHHLILNGSPIDYYFYDYTDCDTAKMLREYFAKLYEQCKLGLFDSLAHLDYPTRYMRLRNVPYSLDCCIDEIDAILKFLVENEKSLEINTSGLFAPFCDTLPTKSILERYSSFGGKAVTIGSDSHKAEYIGRGFDTAVKLAADVGITHIAYYKNRNRHLIKIDR